MQDSDFSYFISNNEDLFSRYGHKFLAIKECTVLGAYDSLSVAVNETMKIAELGTFIAQECTGEESAYTVYITTPGMITT